MATLSRQSGSMFLLLLLQLQVGFSLFFFYGNLTPGGAVLILHCATHILNAKLAKSIFEGNAGCALMC